MIGVIVNVLTVLIGSAIGLTFRKSIPEKITKAAVIAIGLCIICIGVSGMLSGTDTIILIVSMVIGTMIGTLIDIDGKLNSLTARFEGKNLNSNIAEGFVTASLVFCVGSMTLLGGIDAGIKGDNTLYYTKALLDFITSIMLSATLGFGVIFSSLTVLIYQGALVALAKILAPYLTEAMMCELTCAGSLMIFALGLNLAGVSKFKVANFLPAIIVVPIACVVKQLF